MLKSFLNKIMSNNSSDQTETNPSHFQTQKIYLFESNQKELEDIISFPITKGVAPGYVYFVQEYMNGTFKIGKTKHVERRMNLFGVKLPFENKLIYLIQTANYHQTEVAFHKHFSDKRLEGEWFALTKEDISWIRTGKYTPDIKQTLTPLEEVKEETATIDDTNDEKPLTTKQIDFAKTLIQKLDNEYILNVSLSSLTQTDLKRLSVYFRFKNKGALTNLIKSGVLIAK